MLNNIKSTFILKKFLSLLKKRIKLKLVKYNKSLKDKLNIKLKEFQGYAVFNELQKNNCYFEPVDIKDIDIEELY